MKFLAAEKNLVSRLFYYPMIMTFGQFSLSLSLSLVDHKTSIFVGTKKKSNEIRNCPKSLFFFGFGWPLQLRNYSIKSKIFFQILAHSNVLFFFFVCLFRCSLSLPWPSSSLSCTTHTPFLIFWLFHRRWTILEYCKQRKKNTKIDKLSIWCLFFCSLFFGMNQNKKQQKNLNMIMTFIQTHRHISFFFYLKNRFRYQNEEKKRSNQNGQWKEKKSHFFWI